MRILEGIYAIKIAGEKFPGKEDEVFLNTKRNKVDLGLSKKEVLYHFKRTAPTSKSQNSQKEIFNIEILKPDKELARFFGDKKIHKNFRRFLSCSADGKICDLWKEDDNSGRQKFYFSQTSKRNIYNICVYDGVQDGKKYLNCSKNGKHLNIINTKNYDIKKARIEWEIVIKAVDPEQTSVDPGKGLQSDDDEMIEENSTFSRAKHFKKKEKLKEKEKEEKKKLYPWENGKETKQEKARRERLLNYNSDSNSDSDDSIYSSEVSDLSSDDDFQESNGDILDFDNYEEDEKQKDRKNVRNLDEVEKNIISITQNMSFIKSAIREYEMETKKLSKRGKLKKENVLDYSKVSKVSRLKDIFYLTKIKNNKKSLKLNIKKIEEFLMLNETKFKLNLRNESKKKNPRNLKKLKKQDMKFDRLKVHFADIKKQSNFVLESPVLDHLLTFELLSKKNQTNYVFDRINRARNKRKKKNIESGNGQVQMQAQYKLKVEDMHTINTLMREETETQEELLGLDQNMNELVDMMKDMQTMVDQQDVIVDSIGDHITQSANYIEGGRKQIKKADETRKFIQTGTKKLVGLPGKLLLKKIL